MSSSEQLRTSRKRRRALPPSGGGQGLLSFYQEKVSDVSFRHTGRFLGLQDANPSHVGLLLNMEKEEEKEEEEESTPSSQRCELYRQFIMNFDSIKEASIAVHSYEREVKVLREENAEGKKCRAEKLNEKTLTTSHSLNISPALNLDTFVNNMGQYHAQSEIESVKKVVTLCCDIEKVVDEELIRLESLNTVKNGKYYVFPVDNSVVEKITKDCWKQELVLKLKCTLSKITACHKRMNSQDCCS